MMTQADVISESLSREEQKARTTRSIETGDSNIDPVVLSPNRIQTEYSYDQGTESVTPNQNNGFHANRNENTPIQPQKIFADESPINNSKGLRNIIIGGMVFSAIITIALIIQIGIGTNQVPYRIGIITQEKVCSDIGADMVSIGGKSIDAFIASSLCLSVVNPFSSGPGAGGFLLIRDHKHDKNLALNCFFKSSNDLNKADYETNPVIGESSVGIPGEFGCITEVYKYARFNWKKLTKPAISLATNGFKVSKHLVEHLKELDLERDIKQNPYMSEMYLKNGELVKENDIITNLRLAATLEKLRDNSDKFFESSVGDSIVEKSKLTKQELVDYKVKMNDVTKTNYNDFVLLAAPFPSNGPIVSYAMKMMETLNLQIEDLKKPEFFTHILQSAQMGYKMSAYIADPSSTTVKAIYEQALEDSVGYFKNLVNGKPTTDPFVNILLDKENYNLTDNIVTNFISVNDHNDLMISYTGTLGSAWGSRIMTEEGFILNNAMNFFTYGQSNANENNNVEAGKQPRGLFTPLLAYNEKNPCVHRFSVSYSHHGTNDDFGLTELTGIMVKLFTDYSLYDKSLSEKRVQYNFDKNACFENGFDSKVKADILDKKLFQERTNCSFYGIDLVMKKDHIIYSKTDTERSMDSAVTFNK